VADTGHPSTSATTSPADSPSPPDPAAAQARNRPNPFAADVCADPLDVDETRSVAGMNRDVVSQIATAIDERQHLTGRAAGSPLMLLTAPRAGYGKTHLLGRVAAATGGQVTLVPLAFRLEDEIGRAAVALRGIEALNRAAGMRAGWSRLREVCAGVCATLLLRLIKDGRLPCANPDQAVRVLSTDPGEIFAAQGSARLIGDWLRKHIAQLRKPLADTALELLGHANVADLEKWVQALLAVASDGDSRSVDALRTLATGGAGEGCEMWLRLLASWRSVVVLVDHLDGFYRNEQAGLRIAMLLLDLTELDGVHVVLSLNQDVWQATFGHHLPSALEDRLTASQVLLRGLGADDAETLISMRLDQARVPGDEAAKFLKFIDVKRHFLGRPLGSVSARVFLRHAAQQWIAFQHSVDSGAADLDESADDESLLPVIQENAARPAHTSDVAVFDAPTGDYMKRVAESLSEPVAALPQNEPPQAPAQALPLTIPPAAPESSGHPAPKAAADAAVASIPTLGAAASARSAGAFEKLRDMLDKLRAADARTATASNGTHAAATTAPASYDATLGRDAVLGRFEALRLQMAAEAESRQLDLSKLADLVRLAGKRFPLVHFDEVELPGLTGSSAARWMLKGSEIVFGLCDFSDRRYWQTLASFAVGRQAALVEAAECAGEPAPQFKIIAFKSDRDSAAWSQLTASGVFPPVLRDHIDPLHLDVRSIAALYAMQRMIKEAQSGAIKAEPAQVMSVLARELDFFWKRVTRPLMQTR